MEVTVIVIIKSIRAIPLLTFSEEVIIHGIMTCVLDSVVAIIASYYLMCCRESYGCFMFVYSQTSTTLFLWFF